MYLIEGSKRKMEPSIGEEAISQNKLKKEALKGNLYLHDELISMLHDTGASISIISTRLVRELNLEVTTLPQMYMISWK